ncbi:MAG TPA: methyltransferase domain-containing protein, partial [Acidimicrobiia bacterium]
MDLEDAEPGFVGANATSRSAGPAVGRAESLVVVRELGLNAIERATGPSISADMHGEAVAVPHASESQVDLRWDARGGPFDLLLPSGVFVPSHTSQAIAAALEIDRGATVIDVGCGCGVLSFVAARLGAGLVFGTDISKDAVATASQNALRLGLDHTTDFRTGSFFDPLERMEADVIIGDVSGVPDALADLTGWLPGGGPSGAEVPLAMLEEVHDWLRPGGCLYL